MLRFVSLSLKIIGNYKYGPSWHKWVGRFADVRRLGSIGCRRTFKLPFVLERWFWAFTPALYLVHSSHDTAAHSSSVLNFLGALFCHRPSAAGCFVEFVGRNISVILLFKVAVLGRNIEKNEISLKIGVTFHGSEEKG